MWSCVALHILSFPHTFPLEKSIKISLSADDSMKGLALLKRVSERSLGNALLADYYVKMAMEICKVGRMTLANIKALLRNAKEIDIEEAIIDYVNLDMLLEARSRGLWLPPNVISMSDNTSYFTPVFTCYAIASSYEGDDFMTSPEVLAKLLGFVDYFKAIKARNPEKRGLLALSLIFRARAGYVSVTEIRELALKLGFKNHELAELIPELKGLDLLIPVVEATGALRMFLSGDPPYYRIPKFLILGLRDALKRLSMT